MKTIAGLSQENKDALKFVLESVDTNDTKVHIYVKDLRTIDRICDLIEKCDGDSLVLEDADHSYLKGKFDGFGAWNPDKTARAIVMDTSDKLNA